MYAEENPHEILVTHYQHEIRLNVWLGIYGQKLVGPIFIEGNLNSEKYRDLLEENFGLFFEGEPQEHLQRMWFQMDGCPAHNGRIISEWMNDHFPGRWIGRYGVVRNPARSPDFTPLDFYIWGKLKSLVYAEAILNVEHLRQRIIQCCNQMRVNNAELLRTTSSVKRRLRLCLRQGGGHFEHLL